MTDDRNPATELELLSERRSDGRFSIRCVVAGELLHADILDPASQRRRREFAAALKSKFPSIDEEKVEAELLSLLIQNPDVGNENQTRAEDDAGKKGSQLTFGQPDLWPDAVDGKSLLSDIQELVTDYVVLPDHAAVAIVLWIVHTWMFELREITPRLAFVSPERRCGKTTLTVIISRLVHRALKSDNISAAAVFRVVQQVRPTLLIDEFDTFLPDNEELRGVINSGHERNGQVLRCVGDDHEVRAFSTFCPVVLAGIGQLPGTVEDRSVVIRMRRKMKGEEVRKVRSKQLAARIEPLLQKLARWVKDNQDELSDDEPEIPDSLNDRAADNWTPLMAIADIAGGSWPASARKGAMALSGDEDVEDSSSGIQLLSDIREFFHAESPAGWREQKTSSADLVDALNKLADSPWPGWSRGRGLNQRSLSKLLKPFEIRPKSVRIELKTPKGYEGKDFEDAFTCYLPPLTLVPSATSDTSLQGNDLDAPGIRNSLPSVADGARRKCLDTQSCGAVADGEGEGDPVPDKTRYDLDHVDGWKEIGQAVPRPTIQQDERSEQSQKDSAP